MNKIRVLIVDDSAVVRQVMTEILNSDPEIEVMATAVDPYQAAERIVAEIPDVMILDVEMPRMDGLTFLKMIMSQHPIPVVMCSSLTGNGSDTGLKALEYGAVELVAKPKVGIKNFLAESKITICDAVKAAAMSRRGHQPPRRAIEPKLTADVIIQKPSGNAMIQTTEKVVVIGASTGGTEALRIFLEMLPYDAPGMVIVQHMPEKFTKSFADRLNEICKVKVKEAKDNDSVIPGQVLIAPGNYHTLLKRSGARYYVEVKEGPLVSRHRPSVDVLFRSAARYAGKNCVGVIMTGMGDDGAQGMLEMKREGAMTIAQDEASCVVYGMPCQAVKMGGVDEIHPLNQIAFHVLKACK